LIERFKAGQHLILTGGSPLKQEKECIAFLKAFIAKYGFKPYVEVENEAVLMPSTEFVELVDWWNNSPKLANSGMKERVRIKPLTLAYMGSLPNSVFKFVVNSEEDWNEIQKDYITPGFIIKEKIVIMPEGQTQEELSKTRELAADIAIREGVRFTDRLHVTIWNKKTGV
jgi:organic radical activating enzyme